MINKKTILMAIVALGFIVSSAFAATMNFSGSTGASITITPTAALIPGAQPLVFNPSTQVNISGGTERTGFAVYTGHDAVKGKDSGQNYGMASDSNDVFWQVAPATYTALSGKTNSSAFSGAGWNRM